MLTQEQKAKLKKNCLLIKDYLEGLVNDYESTITLRTTFDDSHCSICVRKGKYGSGGTYVEVDGYSGGLPIKFEEDKDNINSTPWSYEEYGIKLCKEWDSIKNDILYKLNEDIKMKKIIMDFKL